MSEKPSEPDEGAMPEEVAKLYAQAHKPGSRYRDFSASRKEVQDQFRDRIERELAERAGVEPVAASTRPVIEQVCSSQFQSGLDQAPELALPARNGPLPVPAPVAPSDTAETREVTHIRPPGPHARAAPATTQTPDQTSPPWYDLPSDLAPTPMVADSPVMLPPGFAQRPPAVAVFSLVSGVGRTALVATLGRALSALGEQVLLADTAQGGLLPFYFGSRESKPGVVRTFFAPSFSSPASIRVENQASIQLLNLEAQRFPRFESGQDWLLGKLVQVSRGASRILIDVATANREISRLLLWQPIVLVPILPDMDSVASLQPVESLLGQPSADRGMAQVFYLLNQFDASSALHRDLREALQLRLGESLLPFVIRTSSAVSEALAEGMTAIDYAPDSEVAEDYRSLAAWLSRIAPPAPGNARGARWRER